MLVMNTKKDAPESIDNYQIEKYYKVIENLIYMTAGGVDLTRLKIKPGSSIPQRASALKVLLFGEESSNDSSDSSDTESDDSSENESGREDPNEVKNPKKGKTIYYKDFFEGNALVNPPNKIAQKAIFTPYIVYLDYKQIFVDMLTTVEKVPNDFKHDISGLLYPVLVLVYLRMVVGGHYKMAKKFLQENENYLEDIYDRSIAKLRRIRRPNQVPSRAIELLFGKDLIQLEMPKAALLQLMKYIDSNWLIVHRELFLAHIAIDGFDQDTPPPKRPPLRRPPLEEIKWADLTYQTNGNLQGEERHKEIKSCFLIPPLLEEGEEVICASFLQDGCWLVKASVDFTIRLVAVKLNNALTLLNSFTGHKGKVYTGDISPDRRFLISCSLDGTIRLWCLVFGTCMGIYNQMSPVRSVVFSPMGHYFATASEDRLARLWLANCEEPILQMSGHLAELDVCIFHPTGRYLTTGSADLTVRMWDIVNSGKQVRFFYGHYGAVTALAFSRSGRYLVSGGRDFVFVIWDITNERPLRSLFHHKAPISAIGFAMDDSRLAVGCLGTYLSIWDFDIILESQVSRDQPILVFSHPNKGGPIFKTCFVQYGLLISICSKPPNPKTTLEKVPTEAKNKQREKLKKE